MIYGRNMEKSYYYQFFCNLRLLWFYYKDLSLFDGFILFVVKLRFEMGR